MEKRPDDYSSRGASEGMRWLGPLGRWINRRLNAPAAADPLYLSNRTLGQKMRVWALVAVPCLAVAGVLCYGLAGGFGSDAPPPAPAVSRPAPTPPPVRVESNHDLDVMEARIVHGRVTMVEGSIRNNTKHLLSAEIVFDLTDAHGSQLGAATARVDQMKPEAVTPFRLPVQEPNAELAIVHSLRSL